MTTTVYVKTLLCGCSVIAHTKDTKDKQDNYIYNHTYNSICIECKRKKSKTPAYSITHQNMLDKVAKQQNFIPYLKYQGWQIYPHPYQEYP